MKRESIDRIKECIKQIENWEGEAYMPNDEVGLAILGIKQEIGMHIDKVTEWCPICNNEVLIPSHKTSKCPKCDSKLAPCSMCYWDTIKCDTECPYE